MKRSGELRERLGDLARSRSGSAALTPGGVRASTALASEAAPAGVEAFLPGGEWRGERGVVFVHERLRSEIERRRSHWGRVAATPEFPELEPLAIAGLERALFLDLETGGLSSSPVFLAGTMRWNGEDFVLRQIFARHYGEEAALIESLAGMMPEFDTLVTFNGKSYDLPFLLQRASLHGVALRPPSAHLDLLHLARRRWKHDLRDCRLQTLERHVCRRVRSGDVPGEEVPGLYHDFVRRGDPYRLIPVFHHNLLDVITMAEILRALGAPAARLRSAMPR
ncbi:MAG: ribonuclease H-like domain-containing protein [Candidatus Eiseniibacteriota bacterium]